VDPQPRTRRLPRDSRLADVATAGYGELLELEADRRSLARTIDALLEAGAFDEAIALIAHQRELVADITRRRAELDGVTSRFRSAGAPPQPGP
jgi:hypothetical protein